MNIEYKNPNKAKRNGDRYTRMRGHPLLSNPPVVANLHRVLFLSKGEKESASVSL